MYHFDHFQAGLSRPGARCRDCSRSVSPGRSPNPPCGRDAAGWDATAGWLAVPLAWFRGRSPHGMKGAEGARCPGRPIREGADRLIDLGQPR
jgi:hypothetical protein